MAAAAAKATEPITDGRSTSSSHKGWSKKISTFRSGKPLALPESANDEGAADCERHPGDGADGQGEPHGQLGGAEVLEEPEEVRLEEPPHRAADEEDQEEHEDVRLQDQLPQVLEHFLGWLLEAVEKRRT